MSLVDGFWLLVRKTFSFFIRLYNKSNYHFFYKKYEIDQSFNILGSGVQLYGDGKIVLGKNGYCGNFVAMQAVDGCSITIGENSAISHNVRIYTSNRLAKSVADGESIQYKKGNVTIGDNVWIGANVFIVEGVNIGDNVVIGANSVVTKDISSRCVVAGAPAIVIYKS